MQFHLGIILIFISVLCLGLFFLPRLQIILKRKRDEIVAKTEKQADALFIVSDPKRNLKLFAVLSVCVFFIAFLSLDSLFLGFSLGALTAALPYISMQAAKRKRKKALEAQLPEVIEKLSGALRAGNSLQAAFESAASRTGGAMAQESAHVMKEVALGLSMEEALSRMSRRIGSDDVTILNTALSVAMRTGGNVSEVLDNIASSIRERRTLDGKIKALTSQGRMQGMIIGLLPLLLLAGIYLIDPAMVEPLFTTTIGKCLLLGGVVLEIAGMLFIRKIVDIKY
jgi:tight adherence protein B